MTRDDFEERLLREVADAERGTWREDLRTSYAPWYDMLDFGFQCADGWRDIVTELTAEIAKVVGGPDAAPGLKVVQVKEKLGMLRFYIRDVPELHGDAVGVAVGRAEERSAKTCESCGAAGKLRQSEHGYWHVACDSHVIR